ncbi:hypothetical protein LINPERHAP1_LOCUS16189 [Linum perenne]
MGIMFCSFGARMELVLDGSRFVLLPFLEKQAMEANEWADRSCLVRIFWDHLVPLQAVRGTLDDMWKCRGELNIFEAGVRVIPIHLSIDTEKELGAQNSALVLSAQNPNRLSNPGVWSTNAGKDMRGSHAVVSPQVIVGAFNGTGIKTSEAFVTDAVGTEKTLKRKKVYEDKGKAKISELEKEPKKLLLGNKGIVIRVLDEEAYGERDSEVEANKIWPELESNEDDESPWVSRIDTYGTNEGTIGEMLREEEGLDKEF